MLACPYEGASTFVLESPAAADRARHLTGATGYEIEDGSSVSVGDRERAPEADGRFAGQARGGAQRAIPRTLPAARTGRGAAESTAERTTARQKSIRTMIRNARRARMLLLLDRQAVAANHVAQKLSLTGHHVYSQPPKFFQVPLLANSEQGLQFFLAEQGPGNEVAHPRAFHTAQTPQHIPAACSGRSIAWQR